MRQPWTLVSLAFAALGFLTWFGLSSGRLQGFRWAVVPHVLGLGAALLAVRAREPRRLAWVALLVHVLVLSVWLLLVAFISFMGGFREPCPGC